MKKIYFILILVVLLFGMIFLSKNNITSIANIQKFDKEASEVIECQEINDLNVNIVLYKNNESQYCLMGLNDNNFNFSAKSNDNASINIYEQYEKDKRIYIIYGNDSTIDDIEYKVNGNIQHIFPEKKDYVLEVIMIDKNKIIEDIKVMSADDEILLTYD